MIKVFVADNSALMRRCICDIINADGDFQVVEDCRDGQEAYTKLNTASFDLVILDMDLPGLSGIEVLKKLGDKAKAVPVIILSSCLKEDTARAVGAMHVGAADFVEKPLRSTFETRNVFKEKLMESVRAVLSIQSKPIEKTQPSIASPRRVSREGLSPLEFAKAARESVEAGVAASSHLRPVDSDALSRATIDAQKRRAEATKITKVIDPPPVIPGTGIIALACSTGGPQALHTFIPMLPVDLPLPLVLVQHMPAGFTASLAQRLDSISDIRVREAQDGEIFKAGTVYITPGGRHMEIKETKDHRAYAHLTDDPPVNSLRPCADVMYVSLAETSIEEVICIVLTGMGADGTEGIAYLSQYKQIYCISEAQESCVVYGMPKAVAQRGLSNEVVPLKEIANSLTKKLGEKKWT